MKNQKQPIAVIGMGCRFPGEIYSPQDFWQFLKEGKDAINEVPTDRWNNQRHFDPNPQKAGKIKANKGGFVKNVADFDVEFFDKFPSEAERIDPQQRFLLEVTYEAFQDAGIKLESISGTPTSVYIGVFMNDYWDIQASSIQKNQISPHVAMGVSLTSIANRISYVYNLKGPSMTIDTACSSSLVCVHQACQSLWLGESKLAVAGGVNLMLRPESSIMMSKGNFLSPDGHCKAFDSRANGYVRSEGCGIVVLKPLSEAIKDRDEIYAVIKGSAVNQDGHTEEGFTVPSVEAQTAMLNTAYDNANIDPASVKYVEAHGTGTPVGDPRETQAFGNVFGKNRSKDDKLFIGSVKTNIGHLEAAAGIAGFIKLALVLKNNQIPQNLHFINPNPAIPFDQYKLKVPTQLETISRNGKPLAGGVNSFGAGGTNDHVVMEEYVPINLSNGNEKPDQAMRVLPLSAKTEEALQDVVTSYQEFLASTTHSLNDICFSAATRRSALPVRLCVSGRNISEIQASLTAFQKQETRPGMVAGNASKDVKRKIGFIYSGQGPQWYAMGRQLINTSPVFRNTILKIESLFAKVADWSLLEEMNRDEKSTRISDTRIAQPAIMAIQIALTELWKSWGITPEGVVGHSIGEVAAAYAASALTLEQAVEVIYHRSREQNRATNKGKMLAVGMPVDQVRKEIHGLEEKISIAAINGPAMVALSGDVDALEIVEKNLAQKEVFHRYLKVTVPFHCHHMEPLKEELISSLDYLQPSEANIPLYSTVTGNMESGLHLVSEYWYRNVRETVYFTDALQSMINDGFNTFIEIAPHPILTVGANDLLQQNNVKHSLIVPSLRRKEDEELTMAGSLGQLFTSGHQINWPAFMGEHDYVKLPPYPWQHQAYWFETEEHRNNRVGAFIHPFLQKYTQSIEDKDCIIWDLNLNKSSHPFLEGHKVEGAVVFPATGFLEIAQATANYLYGSKNVVINDVNIENPLFLPEDGELKTRLEITSNDGDFTVFSKMDDPEVDNWSRHFRGKINRFAPLAEAQNLSVDKLQAAITEQLSVPDYYVSLKEKGLNYGDSFRCIQKLFVNQTEILAAVSLPHGDAYEAEQYLVHPALLDACLHSLFAINIQQEEAGVYLPVHVDSYRIYSSAGSKVWCYIQVTKNDDQFLCGNYKILDGTGKVVAELMGLQCKFLHGSNGKVTEDVYSGVYQYQWKKLELHSENNPLEEAVSGKIGENVLVFADSKGLGDRILQNFKGSGVQAYVVNKSEIFDNKEDKVFEINPLSPEHYLNLLKYIKALDIRIDQILYLWNLDFAFDDDLENTRQLYLPMMYLLKSLVANEYSAKINLFTTGAEGFKNSEIDVFQSPLYGMARVMMNEYPVIPFKVLDVPQDISDKDIHQIKQILSYGKIYQNIREFAFRSGLVYYRELVANTKEEDDQNFAQLVDARGSRFTTKISEKGIIDSITFVATGNNTIDDDHIEIEVRASGMNFKDVMNGLGLLSEESVQGGIAGSNLGLECAGVVTKVGKNVKDISVGDEVMAWSANCYAGYTVAPQHCVVKKPRHLTFEEAASITVVYLTAHYGLNYLARISAEDVVLIHSASGGVGLAAIQLAKLCRAKIIATAGTPEKRAYLSKLGIEHVFDSRSMSFADDIMRVTHGNGVDVILNSLSGAAITKSINCLAPFGRFIEIGKADIYNNRKLSLKSLGENISYFVVDVDRLMLQRPLVANKLYNQVREIIETHYLKPESVKVFPVSELANGLQQLSKGKHIGKYVVTMEKAKIKLLPPETLRLADNASYLITGGASGFGLQLAKWLSEKGARNLILVSRSGCKTDYDRSVVDKMIRQGVNVRLENLDITNSSQIARMISDIQKTLPPLKGVIHGAAVLRDASIPTVNEESFYKVFNPKVLGAWNLHRATEQMPLDFFLTLSSISSAFGIPGQLSYSSANNFLDRLAHFRNAKGLAGTSVNLGLLGSYAGMTKDGGDMINVLANQGWDQLTYEQIMGKLERLLIIKPAQRTAANINWKKFDEFFMHLKDDFRYKEVLKTMVHQHKGNTGGNSILDQLMNKSSEDKDFFLREKLVESLAKILGTSVEKIATEESIAKMGLDSLMMNQLRNWIHQKFEINYPLMKLAKGPSINELSGQLLEQLFWTKEEENQSDYSGIGGESDIEVLDRWLIRNKNNQQQIKKRIFCFHPVGAGASMFSHFIFNPPPETDVLAFQLPGRENRKDEAVYEDIDVLVKDLAEVIKPYLDLPFAIYGHSFGGIIGFELIRYLRMHFQIEPMHFFISGTIAPQLTKKWKERDVISKTAITSTSDEKLLSLMTYIDDVDFLKQILPVMKKDMPLIMGYPYRDDRKFDFPITAFAADKDEVVFLHELEQWVHQTTDNFQLEVMEGDHWFLSRNKERILERVSQSINVQLV